MSYPVVGKDGGPTKWPLLESQVRKWQESYQGTINVELECRKALLYVEANPKKRKTAGGMSAFLVRWLNRACDSGRNGTAGATAAPKEAFKW